MKEKAVYKDLSLVFAGTLGVRLQRYHHSVIQVAFIQEAVFHEHQLYEDVELVSILLRERSGKPLIQEEYCRFLPYLKPIATFRGYIGGAVVELMQRKPADRRFLTGPLPDYDSSLLRDGLNDYWHGLRLFNASASLVKQAKKAVNALDPGQGVSAKAVLQTLGQRPETDLVCASVDHFLSRVKFREHELEEEERCALKRFLLALDGFGWAHDLLEQLRGVESSPNSVARPA